MTEKLNASGPVRSGDFSETLYYKLVLENSRGYEGYLDVSRELSDRILNRLDDFRDYDSFCDLLKTKEMTYTRISRCLLHILLNMKKEDMEKARVLGTALYARVLGFRRSAAPLLSRIRERSSIPVVTKTADAVRELDGPAAEMLKQDLCVSQIYNGVLAHKNGRAPINEIATPLVIL